MAFAVGLTYGVGGAALSGGDSPLVRAVETERAIIFEVSFASSLPSVAAFPPPPDAEAVAEKAVGEVPATDDGAGVTAAATALRIASFCFPSASAPSAADATAAVKTTEMFAELEEAANEEVSVVPVPPRGPELGADEGAVPPTPPPPPPPPPAAPKKAVASRITSGWGGGDDGRSSLLMSSATAAVAATEVTTAAAVVPRGRGVVTEWAEGGGVVGGLPTIAAALGRFSSFSPFSAVVPAAEGRTVGTNGAVERAERPPSETDAMLPSSSADAPTTPTAANTPPPPPTDAAVVAGCDAAGAAAAVGKAIGA